MLGINLIPNKDVKEYWKYHFYQLSVEFLEEHKV